MIIFNTPYSAKGDGVADDTIPLQAALNQCFSSPDINTQAPFVFPAGNFRITQPLTLRSLNGAIIQGSGQQATRIVNSAGGSVFVTNGCQYSRFENMHLVGSSPGILFDLDWDGTGPAALQSNKFINMLFEGGSTGLRIGQSDWMGSENLILGCYFQSCAEQGILTANFNALQQSVIGCNFQACGIGIFVQKGSCPIIHGTGFQLNTHWDIRVDNSANDTMSISGCRTESINFAQVMYQPVHVSGCCQSSGTAGAFLVASSPSTVSSCVSVNGQVNFFKGGCVDCSQFGRDDWIVVVNDYTFTRALVTGQTLLGQGSGTQTRYNNGFWYHGNYTDLMPH